MVRQFFQISRPVFREFKLAIRDTLGLIITVYFLLWPVVKFLINKIFLIVGKTLDIAFSTLADIV